MIRTGGDFPLTPNWAVQANVRTPVESLRGKLYNAMPKERIEQEYVVQRSMHCWLASVSFRKRPGFTETFVRLELKTHADLRKTLESPLDAQYYPGRGRDR